MGALDTVNGIHNWEITSPSAIILSEITHKRLLLLTSSFRAYSRSNRFSIQSGLLSIMRWKPFGWCCGWYWLAWFFLHTIHGYQLTWFINMGFMRPYLFGEFLLIKGDLFGYGSVFSSIFIYRYVIIIYSKINWVFSELVLFNTQKIIHFSCWVSYGYHRHRSLARLRWSFISFRCGLI